MITLRVLVVDDIADVAAMMARLLKLSGHEAFIATNGLEGLQMVENCRPDVVLLDIGLPGLDGWQVATKIRERANGKRPFIIAISGYAREEDYRRSAEAGIDLHLAKPVDMVQLVGILERLRGTMPAF